MIPSPIARRAATARPMEARRHPGHRPDRRDRRRQELGGEAAGGSGGGGDRRRRRGSRAAGRSGDPRPGRRAVRAGRAGGVAGGGPRPRISRRALGAIVFADPVGPARPGGHPASGDARALPPDDRAPGRATGGRPCIVLDAAVLLEAGWDDLCDRIVFVDAPRAERLRRVEAARGWSERALEARERSQWPVDEKRRRADWIIDNDGAPGSTWARGRSPAGPACGRTILAGPAIARPRPWISS